MNDTGTRRMDPAKAILSVCRKHPNGLSSADIAALSNLSLHTVRECAPRLADEYRGRIQVSERGELIWSFPKGFTSRFTGFSARLGRFIDKALGITRKASMLLFKAWILLTLVGYFLVFILLAVASIVALSAASMAGNDNRQNSRRGGSLGGFFLARGIFDLAIRLWFYSEITRVGQRSSMPRKREKKTPLHLSVFDFVFGPPETDRDLDQRQTRAFGAFIAKRKGYTSLGEFMALSGLCAKEAGARLLEYCSRFEGQADLGDNGEIMYRFDKLLERSMAIQDEAWPRKQLPPFSTNKPSLNRGFSIINAVNLVFGLYFIWQHSYLQSGGEPGPLSILYLVAENLLSALPSPGPLLYIVLGIIPLSFSLLFYLIPLLRSRKLKARRRRLSLEEAQSSLLKAAWDAGSNGKSLKTDSRKESLSYQTLSDLALYTEITSTAQEDGSLLWQFPAFVREAQALQALRSAGRESGTGNVIFDSHDGQA